MNAITSHEGSDVLRWMSPSSWPPGGSRALGRSRPNESWSTSKRFRPRATDHGDGTRCEYRSLAVRRGGCEPASSTTLIDAAARFELQGGPRNQPSDPIGHARMSCPGIGGAAQAGRVDLGGERRDRAVRLEPVAGSLNRRAAARTIGPIGKSVGWTPVLTLLRRSRSRRSTIGSLAP